MVFQIIQNSLANIKCNNLIYREAPRLFVFLTPPVFLNHQKSKHWNPKFKKERKAKFLEINLPDFDEQRREKDLPIETLKDKLKKVGIAPYRPWFEKPMHISCLGGIIDAYVPSEKDVKATIVTSQGVKQIYDSFGTKGKSYLALRKIRNIDYDFDVPTAAEHMKDIYIEVQTALAKGDTNRLHELVTEKAFPEMTENLENLKIEWKYIQTLDHPRIVHIRCQDVQQKDNLFAQVTLRLLSREKLAIYDRFGRFIRGSEETLEDSLQYIVFEKHISSINGSWRIHGKIVPDWMLPKRPIKTTYFLPSVDALPNC